nr:immunoglobulin light chain junction region [Macaca mulatta]MOW74571.1 immunoglobulin light chain junction region [Macaca mulatta]MOX23537.1 immunoglobulin light chain junction region [Macaca mulatta]MOX23543.1 immunoglobulin light chain junction region [Macaca mulatta]MOX23721.1 immunoglobulin light chain junction region [Macaca mulatta]
CQQGYKTPFTF